MFFGNPINAILRAIGRAINNAVASIAGWAFERMIDALQATTAIDLGGWFTGPWRAMAAVAAMLALPLLLVGVVHEVVAGNPREALKRGVLMPLLVGVGLIVTPAMLAGLLGLVDLMCAALVELAIGGPRGFGEALANMQHQLGAVTGDSTALVGLPGAVSVLLLLVVGVLAFVIWVELALRAALVYLLAVLIPLAAAGLFWRNTAAWTRRTIDLLIAVALSKIVITAVMVLAAAALKATPADAAAGVNNVAVGIALLLLGSFALPMTLRVVPHVSEAAIGAGAGALMAHRVRNGTRAVGMAVAAGAGPTGVGFAAASLGGPAAVARLASERHRTLPTATAGLARANGSTQRPSGAQSGAAGE